MSKSDVSVKSGLVTLPAEEGQEKLVAELVKLWKADYIRDSDGTRLSPELLRLGQKVYSTICLVRADQDYSPKHLDQVPEIFLMSEPVTATGRTVVIDPLAGFHREKYVLDTQHDPKRCWEVIDRTTGQVVPARQWTLRNAGKVVIRGAAPFHVYTVNSLCWVIWDTTSMYNHLVNQWDRPHVVSVDPYHKQTWDHLLGYFDRWLKDHPDTNLVRLTTLAYHFTVIMDPQGQDKFRDWTGYQETISVQALRDFEKEYGYRLRSEDFVDEGYYNAATRVPSRAWLDWMDFIHRFVVRFGRELCRRCHLAGKQTGIFWGDHWIGMEPYSPGFDKMGIDVLIGAAEDGVALRRVSDIPGRQAKELRLYPYFFPDVFRPGGKPTEESQSNWVKIRRALLRKQIDRIGYGGYLSLAAKFPEFLKHVEALTDEFRTFKNLSKGRDSWKPPIKVLVLNAWGRKKAWLNSFSPPQKFLVKRQDVVQVAGTNLLECLAGLPVEVDFADFEQIKRKGFLDDVSIIINDGDALTAWSGGRHWIDPQVVGAVRAFVHRGGGFIGCRGPTAFPHQGRFFQLADVLGVDKEVGQSTHNSSARAASPAKHFITDDALGELDLGTTEGFVFPVSRETKVLATCGGQVTLSANSFGRGRAVYLAGLPFSWENARLLLRAIFWAAGQEESMRQWFSSNSCTDCAAWPELGRFVVANHTDRRQVTTIYAGQSARPRRVTLRPYECKWF